MSEGLGGKVFSVGATINARYAITRLASLTDDEQNLENSVITMEFYRESTDALPTVTLAIGAGITRVTNTSSSQIIDVLVDEAQIAALIGTEDKKLVSYVFTLTPVSGVPMRGAEGNGFSGRFYLIKESLAGRS